MFINTFSDNIACHLYWYQLKDLLPDMLEVESKSETEFLKFIDEQWWTSQSIETIETGVI